MPDGDIICDLPYLSVEGLSFLSLIGDGVTLSELFSVSFLFIYSKC